MKTRFLVATAVTAAIAGGCASEKPFDTQLIDQARGEVQALSRNPAASEMASRELAASRSSLAQAEAALHEKNQAETDTYAYLAVRQAKTGEAQIAENMGKQRLLQLRGERDRVFLEARNAELEAQARAGAQQSSRGLVLTLSGVLFESGKATLLPGAEASISRISDYMRQYPKTRLIVEGHTDSQGSADVNQRLSLMRAQSVTDALIQRGISSDRLEAIGHGPEMPVATNATAEGRQQNRRVEVLFSDDAGRFAEGARRGVNR
jgi:outer membrane protein OmpA-like peptidoglycan-associated protein